MGQHFQLSVNKSMESEIECAEDSQLNTTVSVIYYSILWVLIFPIFYMNILVLKMLKREKLSISLELKANAVCNILASILDLAHHGVLNFAFPASVTLGDWYCHVVSVLISLGQWRECIHSLTLSVYRYAFIVHAEKIAHEMQKQRLALTIFAVKWTLVTSFAAKLVIFNKDEFILIWTTACFGNTMTQQENPASLTQSMKGLSERFFYRLTDKGELITVFGVVTGNLSYPLKAFCVFNDVLAMATCTNILEGLFYSRVSKFMKA